MGCGRAVPLLRQLQNEMAGMARYIYLPQGLHSKHQCQSLLLDQYSSKSNQFQDRGFDTPFLNKTLFRKLRYFLGGRVRLMLTGGAPLSPDTHSLSRTCLCLPVMQGYGLTETTACATVTS